VGDKSNCSVICTLFKITFLGKWDERGERPFLWPLTSFPDRHAYSVHSVQYRLSSCFEQFCWDLVRTCEYMPGEYMPFSRRLYPDNRCKHGAVHETGSA